MATYYYPYSDGSGGSTSNSNVRYRIKVDTTIVSSSARTVKITAALQFKNTANWTGTYYSKNIQKEYVVGIGSASTGTGSTWSMTNITSWTTLISVENTVTATSNGNITFNVWAESIGNPTPGRIDSADFTDTVASGLPSVTTTYNITLDPDGGWFTSSYDTVHRTSAKTYVIARGASILDVIAGKTGYINTEWRTAKNGGGTKILDEGGDLINIGQNWTLYPHWAVDQFTIHYMMSYESEWFSQSFDYNTSALITASIPTRNGYNFLGWNTKMNGTGISYTAGDSFPMPAQDIYLYAMWQVEPVTTPTELPTLKQMKIKKKKDSNSSVIEWEPIYALWVKTKNGSVDEWKIVPIINFFIKKNGNWE